MDILSKIEIRDWFKRYFAIPYRFRPYHFSDLAKVTTIDQKELRLMLSGKSPISEKHQVAISNVIINLPYPQPRSLPLPYDKKKQAPIEVLTRLCQAIGRRTPEQANELGINSGKAKLCRLGCIVNFQYSTVKRLMKAIFKEDLIDQES